MPETLDETYERTLREISEAVWEVANRLFQFVAVAVRPLYVEELAELLAFDFETGPIPKFHEGWRLDDPIHAVQSTCPSFFSIVDEGYYDSRKIVQFSHFSVKEFLTSARLKAKDIELCRYHVSGSSAHTIAAQACLGILLHLNEDVVASESLEKYPLAKYAAKYWVDHARFEDVSRKVEDGTKELFNPIKPHLAVCVWIHKLYFDWQYEVERGERPLPLCGTPLHHAAAWGLRSIVEFLVFDHSQQVHSRNFTGNATPLHLASENGHLDVVHFLLERDADVSAQDKDGRTPLHLASQAGQLDVTCVLIEHGADVSTQNKDGQTPLHLASQVRRLDVAGTLIKRGADVSAQSKDGQTPLHLALQEGQLDVARMLIERGADGSAQNKDGQTPLLLALQAGQLDVACMLIKRGTDVTAQNKDGQTSLHLASQAGQLDVARMLIERGADVSAQNKDGQTPLLLASQTGQLGIVCMLVEHGADVSAQNKDGQTPLHLVSQAGQLDVARMLVERGADVSAQNKDGQTPLHLVFQWECLFSIRPGMSSHPEIAHILIKHGADVSAQDKDGQTPLYLASKAAELARVIVEREVDVKLKSRN